MYVFVGESRKKVDDIDAQMLSLAPPKVVAVPAVLQAEAGGFQLTQKVRVPADARADYDNAMRLVDAGQYDQGIALLQRVTQKAPAAAAA